MLGYKKLWYRKLQSSFQSKVSPHDWLWYNGLGGGDGSQAVQCQCAVPPLSNYSVHCLLVVDCTGLLINTVLSYSYPPPQHSAQYCCWLLSFAFSLVPFNKETKGNFNKEIMTDAYPSWFHHRSCLAGFTLPLDLARFCYRLQLRTSSN